MMRRGLILCGLVMATSLFAAAMDPLQTARHGFEAGNYRNAVATLQAALAQNPQDARLHHWLSRCYYELNDYDRAIESAERAVQLEPQNSEYHRWLGRAYGLKADKVHSFGLARKVRREFEEAVRLNPSSIPARRDLIEFLVDAPWIVGGDKDKAWQQAEAVFALDPVEGHLARAICWLDKNKSEQVEAEYRRVLQLRPQGVEPYLEVADFYQTRQDPTRMEATIEAAARVNASDGRLAYYRGVARVLAGTRLTEAEQFLKSYVAAVPPRSDFPSHASAREWLGRLYERLGKREDAASQYRAALQLDPNRKSAREALQRVGKQL